MSGQATKSEANVTSKCPMHLSLALSSKITEGPGEIFLPKPRSLKLFLGRLQAFSQGRFPARNALPFPQQGDFEQHERARDGNASYGVQSE
jgi:hypothetical protein